MMHENTHPVWPLAILLVVSAIGVVLSTAMHNGIKLTDKELIIRHGLAQRRTIRFRYAEIAHIELRQHRRYQIQLNLTTKEGHHTT